MYPEIYPAYDTKHNSNREKQVILLMIPRGKNDIKRLSALLIHFWSMFSFHIL